MAYGGKEKYTTLSFLLSFREKSRLLGEMVLPFAFSLLLGQTHPALAKAKLKTLIDRYEVYFGNLGGFKINK
jgi:hypothetical protein